MLSQETEIRPLQMVDVVGQYRRYQDEIDAAVLAVLRSGSYINGPTVKQFELDMASFLKTPFAIGCASGTDALQIALMALDLKPDDEVITTPFTFAATTETIALLGGLPVYVDIDPDTFNIDVTKIEDAVTDRTRVILPVHLFGQPANMDAIMEIAERRGIRVIEDAAQAVGAKWNGRNACSFGDFSAISYYPSKNLGAFGDAGMITAKTEELEERARTIANHGSRRTYHHEELGVNSRLDAIQAAILSVKLDYLNEWNGVRAQRAREYTELLKPFADQIRTPIIDDRAEMIWHQYTVLFDGDRTKFQESLRERGIPTNVYYPIPLHLQEAYKSDKYKLGDFPATEFASNHVISLPMHSELTSEDVQRVVDAVTSVLK